MRFQIFEDFINASDGDSLYGKGFEFSSPQPDYFFDQGRSVFDLSNTVPASIIHIDQGRSVFDLSSIVSTGMAHTPNFFNDLDDSLNTAVESQDSIGGCGCCGCASQKTDVITNSVNIDGFAGLASYYSGVDAGKPLFMDVPGDTSTTEVITLTGTAGSRVGTASNTLEVSLDQDWFAVTLEAGQRYTIAMERSGANPLEDPLVRLLDSTGLTELAQNDDGLGNRESLITYTIDTTGTYYVSAQAWINGGGVSSTGDYTLTVTEVDPIAERDLDGIAHFLTDEFDTRESYDAGGGTTTINFSFASGANSLSAGAEALARRALDAWAEVADINFVEGPGDIVFRNNGSGAFNGNTTNGAGLVLSSDLNVSSTWNGGNLNLDSYTYQTFLHEIGHALGLGHAGPYNGSATYGVDNAYLNDSWAYTVMSYFSQNESGYFGDTRFVLGPQIADIVALHDLYGANTTTRNGDTVYGFNSTLAATSIFNLANPNLTNIPSVAIYDTGGTDTLDYSGYSVAQRIDLNAEAFSDINGIDGVIAIARGSIIENAIGGSGVDTITGNGEDNELTGGAGNDILDGGAGTDYALYSGAQASYTITDNGDGTWTVAGGSDGSDTLTDIEFARFTDGDVALAAPGGPIFTEGNDNESGTAGDDVLDGLGGDDIIHGLGGNDIIDGGTGADDLFGDAGNDQLNGGDGDDDLNGGAGADVLNGGAGRDRLFYNFASTGVTVNLFNAGLNTGEAAGDTYSSIESLNGSNFDDSLTSGNDENDLVGLNGNDTLIGAGGRDRLFGGNGDDRLLGGTGNDDLNGAAGADTYVIRAGAGTDRIFTYEVGVDTIEMRDGAASFADLTIVQVGVNTEITHVNGVILLMGITAGSVTAADFVFLTPLPAPTGVDVTTDLTAGADNFTGDENNDIVNGLAGNDILKGGIGDDTLNGGADNDQLTGGLGADILDGGAGIDSALYSTASTGVTVNAINSALNTGEAAGDTYISIENFYGSAYIDIITADNNDNDLFGLDGNDSLIGGGGDDRLFGGNHDDRLFGGAGNDDLHGQSGNDTYVIQASAGNDRIFGFEDGLDTIEYRDGPADFASLTITQVGANTTIVSVNGTLTLIGFTATNLDASDFTFLTPAAEAPPTPKASAAQEEAGSQDTAQALGTATAQDVIAQFLAHNQAVQSPLIYTDANGILAIAPDMDSKAEYDFLEGLELF